MTIKELMDLTVEERRKLKKNEIIDILKDVTPFAKARRTRTINLIKEQNLPLPSAFSERTSSLTERDYLSWEDYNFDFSEKDDYDELQRKLKLTQLFFKSKTSTLTGWKRTLEKFVSRLGQKSNVLINPESYEEFWDIYNTLLSSSEGNVVLSKSKQYGSTQLQEYTRDIMVAFSGLSSGELVEMIKMKIRQDYDLEELTVSEDDEDVLEYDPDEDI